MNAVESALEMEGDALDYERQVRVLRELEPHVRGHVIRSTQFDELRRNAQMLRRAIIRSIGKSTGRTHRVGRTGVEHYRAWSLRPWSERPRPPFCVQPRRRVVRGVQNGSPGT